MDPEVREISNRLRANKRFWGFFYGGIACFVVGLFVQPALGCLGAGLLFFVGGMFALWYGGDVNVSLDYLGRINVLASPEERSGKERTMSARGAGVMVAVWGPSQPPVVLISASAWWAAWTSG